DVLSAALLVGDAIEHEGDQEGPDHGADRDGINRPAVAEAVRQFLADDDHGAGEIHSAGASCPAKATNASSSEDLPVRVSRSSGVPSAATRPLATTMMRSQSADTSCMMWLENSTQQPSARRRRMRSRIVRVLITSRPLVGSSSRMFR